MNPIPNFTNPVLSHDAVKYVYQEPDIRMVNPSRLNVKPFKVKSPEKTKDANKKKQKDEKKKPLSGFFDLF